jgi:hypothetical protein
MRLTAAGKSLATIGNSVDFLDFAGLFACFLVEIKLSFEGVPVPRDKLPTASTVGRN